MIMCRTNSLFTFSRFCMQLVLCSVNHMSYSFTKMSPHNSADLHTILRKIITTCPSQYYSSNTFKYDNIMKHIFTFRSFRTAT